MCVYIYIYNLGDEKQSLITSGSLASDQVQKSAAIVKSLGVYGARQERGKDLNEYSSKLLPNFFFQDEIHMYPDEDQ